MGNRPSMHLYNVTTLNGVLAACAQAAYSVLYTHINYPSAAKPTEIEMPPLILERGGADGILLVGLNHPNLIERLAELHVPFVLHHAGFVGTLDGVHGGDIVAMDDATGTDLGTRHLIEQGHRRLARASGPSPSPRASAGS